MEAIHLHNVCFSYHTAFAIQEATLCVPEGSRAFLLGPNGAGKTTLFKLVCGLLHPERGSVVIHGNDLSAQSVCQIAQTIAVVEQDNVYLYPFTVEEIVLMGRFAHSASWAFESQHDEERAAWAMAMTDTEQFRHRSILTLSGGERRRVEIARALAQEARILLLDEPTSHLDLKQQREMYALLMKLNAEQGTTLFIISHHLHFIRAFAHKLFFMKSGVVSALIDRALLDNEDQLIKQF